VGENIMLEITIVSAIGQSNASHLEHFLHIGMILKRFQGRAIFILAFLLLLKASKSLRK
jgi:hypothetical protein